MGPIWPLQKRAKFGPPFRAILAPHSRADLAPLVAKLALLKSAPSQWGQFSPIVGHIGSPRVKFSTLQQGQFSPVTSQTGPGYEIAPLSMGSI